MTDLLLGVDLGTSGLKLAALDPDGVVVAAAEAAYPVDMFRKGWAQTEVATWQHALDDALRELAPQLHGRGTVAALGLSGQMHGAVLVDDTGTDLAPALLWPDRRAVEEVERWRRLPATDRAALANPLVPGMTGPLLAWLARHEPELVARARAVVLTGGGARNAAVQQLLADVLGRSVQHVRVRSASAAGAAMIAARGVGVDLAPRRELGPVVDPRPARTLTDARTRWSAA